MSISAYKKTIRQSEDPRDIERRVLSQANRALEETRGDFDTADVSERFLLLANGLRTSLVENQKIWALFTRSLSLDSNELPDTIRADLLSLASFVARQTDGALAAEKCIQPIIDINNNLIDGMSIRVAPAPAPANANAGV